jgi:hypothetical protein
VASPVSIILAYSLDPEDPVKGEFEIKQREKVRRTAKPTEL